MVNKDFETRIKEICEQIELLPLDGRIEALNYVRQKLHEVSPFKNEPCDLVRWIKAGRIKANEYNPNRVARPEMELLFVSMREDGITMATVGMENGDGFEIVDGFHRKETITGRREIADRVFGYVPVSTIEKPVDQRMASTIRHNRARGKHGVEPMAAIIAALVAKGWDDSRIAAHLGMETEEVLRLKQVEGIAAVMANKNYDRAWEVKK